MRNEDDGLRLIEAVRRISPASRVATMTGYASPAIEASLRDAGAVAILYKPLEADEFLAAVRELLDKVSDANNLEEVYAATTPRLMSMVARRYQLSKEDREEVLQQAWCILLEKRSEVRDVGAFLSGTITNLCRQMFQQRSRECALDTFDSEACGYVADSTETLAVQRALSRLDGRSRLLCQKIGLEELSYAEVSKQLSIPIGSIGPLYIRAKQRLRVELSN
jgi:DNA-directed RNA polymerase specialized sigma24 family protein